MDSLVLLQHTVTLQQLGSDPALARQVWREICAAQGLLDWQSLTESRSVSPLQALISANASGLPPPIFRGNWMEGAEARLRWFEFDGTARQMRPNSW